MNPADWPQGTTAPMILAVICVVGGILTYDDSHIIAGIWIWVGLASATFSLIQQAIRNDRKD